MKILRFVLLSIAIGTISQRSEAQTPPPSGEAVTVSDHLYAALSDVTIVQGDSKLTSDYVRLSRGPQYMLSDNPIGVAVEPIASELAAQMQVKPHGLIVVSVQDGLPGAKAGFQPYDLLLKIADTNLQTANDLNQVIVRNAGKPVPVLIRRAAADKLVVVSLPEMTEQKQVFAAPRLSTTGQETVKQYKLGITLSPVDRVLRSHLALPADSGVMITDVTPNSPAEKVGIEADDIVLEVRATPVADEDKLRQAIQTSEGKEISLKLLRRGKSIEIKATPELVELPVQQPLSGELSTLSTNSVAPLTSLFLWDQNTGKLSRRILDSRETSTSDVETQLKELKELLKQLSNKIESLSQDLAK